MTTLAFGLHGEAKLFVVDKLPEGAKKVPHTGDLIIAASETVGNHHRIYCTEKEASLYDLDEKRYLEVIKSVGLVCADKHDQAVLEPGVYEVGKQFEWDYIAEEERSVAD